MSCIIVGCKSHSSRKENDENLSFHRFPTDEILKEKWIKIIARPNWQWKKVHRICSKHFTEDSFRIVGEKWRRLKKNAVPKLQLRQRSILNVHSGEVCKSAAIPSTSGASISETPAPAVSSDQLKQIAQLEQKLENLKKIARRRLLKIDSLRHKTKRLKKKNNDLNTRLLDLLAKEKIEKENLLLLDCVKNNPVINSLLSIDRTQNTRREYSLELKKFAVTLNYLSPRAYSYVRNELKDVLPHPKTISKWYQCINCDPGFTTEAFDAIKERVKNNNGKPLYCALSLDEMAIRKLVEWDGKKYFGYVNIGCDLDSHDIPLAREALTFVLTSVNDTWKIPVGYFLIDTITSQQKALLVKQCLTLLNETGIRVISLTFDGASTNKAMCAHLGCDLKSFEHYFVVNDLKVYLWPDPCHNIKLIRNTFGDKKHLTDIHGNKISWHHVELLNTIQNNEGLHLGTKLKQEHISYVKQKMKVRLATQLFSASVADALEFCKDLGIPEFADCDGTIQFIRVFNNLFDIMNSRNIRAKGWKRALAIYNIEETKVFFDAVEVYIKNLKFLDNSLVVNSNRSTGFCGFITCMRSLIASYTELVAPENSALKYIGTYKLSQDHIELFFGAIRSMCGFNNNPSAKMFRAAYKRLLVHAQFKDGSTGNCLPLDTVTVLNYNSQKYKEAIVTFAGWVFNRR